MESCESSSYRCPLADEHSRPLSTNLQLGRPRRSGLGLIRTKSRSDSTAPSKFALRARTNAVITKDCLYPDVPIEVHLVMPNVITVASYDCKSETEPGITVCLDQGRRQAPKHRHRLTVAGIKKSYGLTPE
ncbi:hypothetical protein GGR52DRAFT_558453 [Hypoxylon sp. FL1284]|nr:hypothetical protein GGR52DRAFT_558453 [Hypoxylon sp. FL1284]